MLEPFLQSTVVSFRMSGLQESVTASDGLLGMPGQCVLPCWQHRNSWYIRSVSPRPVEGNLDEDTRHP